MENSNLEKIDNILKGKTIILGIGNVIRGDDGAGPVLISRLKGKTKAILLDCAEVPENYTQPIIEARPDKIVIVDAADWNGPPGEIKSIDPEEINNLSFSTHDPSLKMFINYLRKRLPKVSIIIIGIQPKRRGFLDSLSPEVKKAVDRLSLIFRKM